MKRTLFCTLLLIFCLLSCRSVPDYSRALPDGNPALLPLGPREPIPEFSDEWNRREEILPALERSLDWTRRAHSKRFFPIAGVTHERALNSLQRFKELLVSSWDPEEFQRSIEAEFQVYKSAGWDGRGGGVLFTAYCTPILRGSLQRDATYRYPLYALPPDLIKGPEGQTLGWKTALGDMPSYPSRGAIEAGGILAERGLELVWLADPIDAYIAHVNGSAFIELPNDQTYAVGYAGKNGREYSSLGRELEEDGKIPRGQASLAAIRSWAAGASEEEVSDYLRRNESFVFFAAIDHNPHGSLDVEVTGGRSLATDKTLFPRAALVFVEAELPRSPEEAAQPFRQFLFDQDTGGAIRTAGRADIYLGIGPLAEARAGRTRAEGQLYYLFLKDQGVQ